MILQRSIKTPFATYGRLTTEDGARSWRTLELPDKGNAPQISCIPAGRYLCARRYSPHNKCEVFEVTGVPGRSDIELHVANYTRELLGCIALGTQLFDINEDGVDDVAHSLDAFTQFMALMDGINQFTLTVRDPESRKEAA